MSTIDFEISKLPVEEKAQLYSTLMDDAETQEYIYSQKLPDELYKELARRDAAVRSGSMKTMTLTEVYEKLAARRNAS